MRFICDVCPSTASRVQTVVIGHYEQWIRHLLTPQHQTEQSLVMARTSYWPEAKSIALIKNLPLYQETTAELYVDVLMDLSNYGFIEAVYYGSKSKDAVCVALQCYETKQVPAYLIGPDQNRYDVKVVPRAISNGLNDASDLRSMQRRSRYNATARAATEVSVAPIMASVGTSPIPCPFLVDQFCQTDLIKDVESVPSKEERIKYDRETLLQYCNVTTMPAKFSEFFTFPMHIIEIEPKQNDPLVMQQCESVKYQAQTINGKNYDNGYKSRNNTNYVPGKENQPVFGRGRQNQMGKPNHSAWRWKNEPEPEPQFQNESNGSDDW